MESKRIVIEGMDGAGKTTLVRQLTTHFKDNRIEAEFIPGYNRFPDPKPVLGDWWLDQIQHQPQDTVLVHDRFFYPELVYGPVLRGGPGVLGGRLNYIQSYLRAHALLVYCRPPTNVLIGSSKVEAQMKGVHSHFNELLLAYDKLMIIEGSYYSWRFVKYDWTRAGDLSKLVQRILSYLN